jgi:flavin reductase (DIM6/NTAB) family NADH-FMN oxidoreductase RutF
MHDQHHVTNQDVMGQIPSALFVLTTAHDGFRSGVLAQWVQRCAHDPPMVMVAIPKGQPVEPIILDSHCFALCHVSPTDRLVLRTFQDTPERSDDPFAAISTTNAPSGSPLIDRAISYIDCRVVRHVELDSDHRVYVGQVLAADMIAPIAGTNGHHVNGNGNVNGSGNGNGSRNGQE